MPTKRILAVMSEYGYWGIELVGPLRKLEAAGYTFDFVTPKGKRAPCLPPSRDTTYIDPPLGTCVTTTEDKALVDAFEAGNSLDATMNLSEMFPERPYFSAPNFIRALEILLRIPQSRAGNGPVQVRCGTIGRWFGTDYRLGKQPTSARSGVGFPCRSKAHRRHLLRRRHSRVRS